MLLYSVSCMTQPSPSDSSPTDCEGRAVGARLRALRHAAGLTQAQLARELGTTQSAVARMEGGGQRLNLESLNRIATVLGCQVAVVIEQRKSA